MKVRSRTPCGSGGTRPRRAHHRDREMSSRSQQTPCRVFIFSTDTMRPAAVTKKGRDVDHLPPVNSRKREPCRSRLQASLHVDTHTQADAATGRGQSFPIHLQTGNARWPEVIGATATRPAGTEGHSRMRYRDSAFLESGKMNRILNFYEHRGQNKDPKRGSTKMQPQNAL